MRLGHRRRDVSAIGCPATERRDAFAEAGNAEGGGTHVGTATSGAKVEGGADDLDRGPGRGGS